MKAAERVQPYLYVLPLVALLAFVFGYPLLRIFEFSFKMVRGIDGPWVGFRNYQLILSQSPASACDPGHGGDFASGFDPAL